MTTVSKPCAHGEIQVHGARLFCPKCSQWATFQAAQARDAEVARLLFKVSVGGLVDALHRSNIFGCRGWGEHSHLEAAEKLARALAAAPSEGEKWG